MERFKALIAMFSHLFMMVICILLGFGDVEWGCRNAAVFMPSKEFKGLYAITSLLWLLMVVLTVLNWKPVCYFLNVRHAQLWNISITIKLLLRIPLYIYTLHKLSLRIPLHMYTLHIFTKTHPACRGEISDWEHLQDAAEISTSLRRVRPWLGAMPSIDLFYKIVLSLYCHDILWYLILYYVKQTYNSRDMHWNKHACMHTLRKWPRDLWKGSSKEREKERECVWGRQRERERERVCVRKTETLCRRKRGGWKDITWKMQWLVLAYPFCSCIISGDVLTLKLSMLSSIVQWLFL